MEEANDDITGWGQHEIKLLTTLHSPQKPKKKPPIDQQQPSNPHTKFQRKFKPSYTLPLIRNHRHASSQPSMEQEKEGNLENVKVERFVELLEGKVMEVGKGIRLGDYMQGNRSGVQMGRGKGEEGGYALTSSKQLHKGLRSATLEPPHPINPPLKPRQTKPTSPIIKGQKVSNLQRLKIQAIDYFTNTPKHDSVSYQQEKNALLKKISKKSVKTEQVKKQKGKYFVVRRDRLSPQQQSQSVSGIAVEATRTPSYLQEPSPSSVIPIPSPQSTQLKEKYKNIIKNIQLQRKNSSIMLIKSQSQQLKKMSHFRRKTNVEGEREGQANVKGGFLVVQEGQIGLGKKGEGVRSKNSNEGNGRGTGGKHEKAKQQKAMRSYDVRSGNQKHSHSVVDINKIKKWDQVLREVENEAKTLKKLKDSSKKKQAQHLCRTQSNPSHMSRFNDMLLMRTRNLTTFLQMNPTNLNPKQYPTPYFHHPSNPQPSYDEFNDECLFHNTGNSQQGRKDCSSRKEIV